MRVPFDHLMTQRIQAPVMKSLNGIGLLNLIRENGPISRADLAKLSDLSKPTVSSQIESLMRQGLVVEQGPGASGARGGKRPTLLRFNADCGRLIAAEVDPEVIRVAITDMEGAIIHKRCVPTQVEQGANRVITRLESAITKSLRDAKVADAEHKIISVAASGQVDVDRGVIVDVGNRFNWHNVPIREKLEKAFGFPVCVDNNVNLATLGEMHHGVAKGEQNFVLVRWDSGIGAGVVIRGRLYHGARWAAGEIAHTMLDTSKAGQDWGPRGYLESIVGADRIAASAHLGSLDAVTAFLAGAAGDAPGAPELRSKIITHMWVALANLVCAYDPALLVLEGRLFKPVLDEVCQMVRKAAPWGPKILFSEMEDEAVLLGAIIAARAHAYERLAGAIAEPDADRRRSSAAAAAART